MRIFLTWIVCEKFGKLMVLTLDGYSEMGAQSHERGYLCYLIYLRQLIRSRVFFFRKDIFSFMRTQHVLSYHLFKNCIFCTLQDQQLFAIHLIRIILYFGNEQLLRLVWTMNDTGWYLLIFVFRTTKQGATINITNWYRII